MNGSLDECIVKCIIKRERSKTVMIYLIGNNMQLTINWCKKALAWLVNFLRKAVHADCHMHDNVFPRFSGSYYFSDSLLCSSLVFKICC